MGRPRPAAGTDARGARAACAQTSSVRLPPRSLLATSSHQPTSHQTTSRGAKRGGVTTRGRYATSNRHTPCQAPDCRRCPDSGRRPIWRCQSTTTASNRSRPIRYRTADPRWAFHPSTSRRIRGRSRRAAVGRDNAGGGSRVRAWSSPESSQRGAGVGHAPNRLASDRGSHARPGRTRTPTWRARASKSAAASA